MSQVPIGASVIDGVKNGHGQPSGKGITENYNGVQFSQVRRVSFCFCSVCGVAQRQRHERKQNVCV